MRRHRSDWLGCGGGFVASRGQCCRVSGGEPPEAIVGWSPLAALGQVPPVASAAGSGCRPRRAAGSSIRAAPAAQERPAPAVDLPAPTECLLDPLADALADRVAGVSGGPPVDRRAQTIRVLRHVRCDAKVSRRCHEVARIAGLFGPQRASRRAIQPRHHGLAGVPLGGASGRRRRRCQCKYMAALCAFRLTNHSKLGIRLYL